MAGFLFLWTFVGGAFVAWALTAQPFSDLTHFLILAVYLLVWGISMVLLLAVIDHTDPVERQKLIEEFNTHWDSQWDDEYMDHNWFRGEARRLWVKTGGGEFEYPWRHDAINAHRFDGIGRPLLNKPRTHRG